MESLPVNSILKEVPAIRVPTVKNDPLVPTKLVESATHYTSMVPYLCEKQVAKPRESTKTVSSVERFFPSRVKLSKSARVVACKYLLLKHQFCKRRGSGSRIERHAAAAGHGD